MCLSLEVVEGEKEFRTEETKNLTNQPNVILISVIETTELEARPHPPH